MSSATVQRLGVVVAVRDATTLDGLADTVRREHRLVEQAGQSMIEHAIAAGEALLEAKAHVPRGEWEVWLSELFPGTALTMPRVYMRVARFADEVRAGNPPTLKAARRMLSHGPHTRTDPRLVQEAQEMRKTGATLKQIGEALGLAESTVLRYVNPESAKARNAKSQAMTVKARRALTMAERAKAAKRAGGDVSTGYSHVRRALASLDAVTLESSRAKLYLREAIHRLYDAEEALGRAIRAEALRASE